MPDRIATAAEAGGVTFAPPPAAGEPLLVLPLPADVTLAAAVMGAAGDWWTDRYGEPLVIAVDPDADAPLRHEHTPYGLALVLRDQPPTDRAAAGGRDGNPAVYDPPPPPTQTSCDRPGCRGQGGGGYELVRRTEPCRQCREVSRG